MGVVSGWLYQECLIFLMPHLPWVGSTCHQGKDIITGRISAGVIMKIWKEESDYNKQEKAEIMLIFKDEDTLKECLKT